MTDHVSDAGDDAVQDVAPERSAPGQRVIRAHAKVNLLLRILARERSGYHGIETLLQRLQLHDVVRVRTDVAVRTLTCDGPTMPAAGLGPPEHNLAWRAAESYASVSGWQPGWAITIEKHIPVGGGLGGGSADAAAVLRAMEQMSPTPIGPARLLELAGALGADVPFFVLDTDLALAWGRGDRMIALPELPSVPVSLFAFAQGVSTGAAYGALARGREAHQERVTARAYDTSAFNSWASISALAANDFEPVVLALHDGVATVLPPLRAWAEKARDTGQPAIGMLSGSGATCFALGAAAGAWQLADDGAAVRLETFTTA